MRRARERLPIALVFGLAIAAIASGCDVVDPTTPDDDETEDPREASVCDDYLEQYCAFGVDCGLLDVTFRECERRYGDVPCVSERLATDCRDALAGASCLEPPRGCDLVDALDHSDATDRCDAFLDALCARDAECGNDYDFCRSSTAADLPCEYVIAVDGDDALCLEAMSDLTCDGSLPSACSDLFLFP